MTTSPPTLQRQRPRRRSGVVIAEWIVATAIGSVVIITLAAFSLYSARSLVSMRNYVELNSQARLAIDRISREIRQSTGVTAYAPDSITLNVASNLVTFAYHRDSHSLVRSTPTETNVLLAGCDAARFDIFMRQATNAVYEIFPTATVSEAKIVRIAWRCSRDILGTKQNNTTMQSAQVVIRKQSK